MDIPSTAGREIRGERFSCVGGVVGRSWKERLTGGGVVVLEGGVDGVLEDDVDGVLE